MLVSHEILFVPERHSGYINTSALSNFQSTKFMEVDRFYFLPDAFLKIVGEVEDVASATDTVPTSIGVWYFGI